MPRKQPVRSVVVHSLRVALFAALLLLIPAPRDSQRRGSASTEPPDVALVQRLLPNASGVDPQPDSSGLWSVRDASGSEIGRVARTLPQAADVVGYRGPSEALVLVDEQWTLVAVDLIQSDDTEEHVAAVKQADRFFDQFRGWTWGGPEAGERIDAVSGATLTSLALARGVLKRIGGDRPSLVFPDPVATEEIQAWYPEAVGTRPDAEITLAVDANQQPIGRVLRTGPLSDDVIGYQGPTELLIQLDSETDLAQAGDAAADPTIKDIKIRKSFDNQPYVRYCKTEYGFWDRFEGMRLSELAAMDLQEAGVEGVSGATMTSLAIAETLVDAGAAFQRRSQKRVEEASDRLRGFGPLAPVVETMLAVRPTPADWGCFALVFLIPLFRARGWFRNRRLRLLWLIAVVVVVGFWSGNLISMALIAGWGGGGMAWQLAPALATVVVVAITCPPAAKANPYCNHLCPHGAIQQLIRPTGTSKRSWTLPARWVTVLRLLPGGLLVAAYVTLLLTPSVELSTWEPFHAYLLGIAPWTSIVLAFVTLLFSAFVPMGYCRFGCPTGRLLDYLRRSANSHRFTRADGVAVCLVLLALTVGAIR